MRRSLHQHMRRLFFFFLILVALVSTTGVSHAQSGDLSFPTPVFSNELSGSIRPRDIGDARRTRHFYTFRGGEGDVIITVESADLTGDVDVFTATTLRPLLKFTLFSGGATKASKSVYLRKEETLVLRVEARSVGDADGSYRIHFGGSFVAAPASLSQTQEPVAASSAGTERGGATGVRRVTSTGARIEEPITESAAKETTSAGSASEKDGGPPAPTSAKNRAPVKNETARTSGSRTARGTTARKRGTNPATARTSPPPETADKENSTSSTPEQPKETTPTNTATPVPARTSKASRTRGTRTTPRKNSTATTRSEPANASEAPTVAAQTAPGQRLIIITKDGNIFQRDMNIVRRVTIENNQVVIQLMDGKTLRQPLANVLRMSIEP